jgi:hypothetical protein
VAFTNYLRLLRTSNFQITHWLIRFKLLIDCFFSIISCPFEPAGPAQQFLAASNRWREVVRVTANRRQLSSSVATRISRTPRVLAHNQTSEAFFRKISNKTQKICLQLACVATRQQMILVSISGRANSDKLHLLQDSQ